MFVANLKLASQIQLAIWRISFTSNRSRDATIACIGNRHRENHEISKIRESTGERRNSV